MARRVSLLGTKTLRYTRALRFISNLMGPAYKDRINLYDAVVTAKMALNPRRKFLMSSELPREKES